jgi:serine/threonine-protein kinase
MLPSDAVIGETVGNYRVTKLLGEGGMGVVYQAEHPGIGRKAAIKMLHPSLATSPEVVARFFNEARAANAVRHPGIVEVFDFGTLPSGASYIIMEFLDGESLASRLKGPRPLSMGEAVELARQTADVLGAAHAKGIVHRDLKPDNIFIVPDLRMPGGEAIKVLDFGIAKLSTEASGSGSVRTRTGTVMGTPLYMSPEQCLGTREVDSRTDIYALGVILYEMVCGRPPFVSSGHGELIHMHIAKAPPPPRSLNPAVPPQLEALLLRTLVKEPNARIQTMGELQQELQNAAAGAEAAPRSRGAATGGKVVTGTKILPTPVSHPRINQTTFSNAASMIDEQLTLRTRSPWGRRLAFLAVAGALGVGAAVYLKGAHPLAPEATNAGAADPQPASPPPTAATTLPAAPSPAPEPAPAAAPKTVSVAIKSEPVGARLVRERDGAAIGVTPFKEDWPAAAGVEKLKLELDGYRSEPFVVPLDRGVSLSFSLTKTASAPVSAKHKPHHAAPSPASEPARTPAPAAPTPKPEPVPL